MARTKQTCRPYKPTHREIIVALRAQAAALQRERAVEAARWREAETAPDGTVDLTEELSDSAVVSDDDVVEVAPPAAAAPTTWERAACSDLTNADLSEGDLSEGADLLIADGPSSTHWCDMPHARCDCTRVPPLGTGHDLDACPMCYCSVCEVPSSKCESWAAHCSVVSPAAAAAAAAMAAAAPVIVL